MYTHILLCFFKNLVLQTDSRNCWFHISFSHLQYLNCLGIANPILWITDSEVERGRLGVCTNIHLLKGDATSSPWLGGGSLQATLGFPFQSDGWNLKIIRFPTKKHPKTLRRDKKTSGSNHSFFWGGRGGCIHSCRQDVRMVTLFQSSTNPSATVSIHGFNE